MAEKINGRLAYADLLRVFASFAVILFHLAGGDVSVVPVGSPNWQIFNLYNSLTHWCVPVFVMLSGMWSTAPPGEGSPGPGCGRPFWAPSGGIPGIICGSSI